MQKLIELYRQWKGAEPANVSQIPGGGSNRTYFRITDTQGQSVIGVIGTSRDEDHAFIYLTEHFSRRQLPVPKILAASDDQLRYLQTDLGSYSLFDAVRGGREAGGRYTLKEQELLKRTIRELPNIQIRGARGLDFTNCYPQAEFNQDSVLFDLNYFKYCFLKATELDFHELKLEADFRLFAKDLTTDEYFVGGDMKSTAV
ncbi:MAG: phosphotransferase, partial [Erysipelotrichaceae bacterium]|nr:phosphotransferase [Erysipelotrichaceae bacterium]